MNIHIHIHNTTSLDPVAASKLQLLLTKLTSFEHETRRNFHHMDEQIDQLNQTADEELVVEQDLATTVHTVLDMMIAEQAALADISKQLADALAAQSGGTVVPIGKINALKDKQTNILANLKALTAQLKTAIPLPPPPPPPTPVVPTITTGSLPDGTDGQAYSFLFTATGDAPITFASPNPPAGMSLASDGTLSGTAVAGTYSIDVAASNAAGAASGTFTLTVV